MFSQVVLFAFAVLFIGCQATFELVIHSTQHTNKLRVSGYSDVALVRGVRTDEHYDLAVGDTIELSFTGKSDKTFTVAAALKLTTPRALGGGDDEKTHQTVDAMMKTPACHSATVTAGGIVYTIHKSDTPPVGRARHAKSEYLNDLYYENEQDFEDEELSYDALMAGYYYNAAVAKARSERDQRLLSAERKSISAKSQLKPYLKRSSLRKH